MSQFISRIRSLNDVTYGKSGNNVSPKFFPGDQQRSTNLLQSRHRHFKHPGFPIHGPIEPFRETAKLLDVLGDLTPTLCDPRHIRCGIVYAVLGRGLALAAV